MQIARPIMSRASTFDSFTDDALGGLLFIVVDDDRARPALLRENVDRCRLIWRSRKGEEALDGIGSASRRPVFFLLDYDMTALTGADVSKQSGDDPISA